jgi:signal transduction histidine kinase
MSASRWKISSCAQNLPHGKVRDIDAELPTVNGDLDRLLQAAINLISNAVKFTDSGSISLPSASLRWATPLKAHPPLQPI